MTDPYQILGIDKQATDEQVKEAYLNMQKKYHPDNYEDSPLKEFAAEKMKEVTQAFDTIMNDRRRVQAQQASGPSVQADATYQQYNAGSNYQQVYANAGGSSNFSDIRRMIQNNRLVEAEELLDGIHQNARDAEWYFLKGTIFFSRGWVDEATNYFSTANRMNPNNAEYKAALNRVMFQRQGNFGASPNGQYRTGQRTSVGGCSACDMCSGLLCADCCCECAGGDLISCC